MASLTNLCHWKRNSASQLVGNKDTTLQAIWTVLIYTNIDEQRDYQFFKKKVRDANLTESQVEIPSSLFMKSNFSVPAKSGGFVEALVSAKDKS